jgi:hypothetical protein
LIKESFAKSKLKKGDASSSTEEEEEEEEVNSTLKIYCTKLTCNLHCRNTFLTTT